MNQAVNNHPPGVVLLLGIMHRSGTNYLMSLLALHPDCTKSTLWEDFLAANAHHLQEFATRAALEWNPNWDPEGRLRDELVKRLGEACISFLAAQAQEKKVSTLSRYIVAKTPSIRGLDLTPMFPRTKTIVIVRDGRDVVESGMKSFGWSFETACRRWVDAAQTIVAAKEKGIAFLLVRYEDLVTDVRGQMARIFKFLDLNQDVYEFDKADTLPVLGSSSFLSDHGKLHWSPIQKTSSFRPIARWAHWDQARRRRYDWLAGEVPAKFGYQATNPSIWKLGWVGRNRLLDWNQTIRSIVRRTA